MRREARGWRRLSTSLRACVQGRGAFRQAFELVGVSDEGTDRVSSLERVGDDVLSGVSGCSKYDEFHLQSPFVDQST